MSYRYTPGTHNESRRAQSYPHGHARTPSTGKLGTVTRANLEARWADAVADPDDWRSKQRLAAAFATNRFPDELNKAWGLT